MKEYLKLAAVLLVLGALIAWSQYKDATTYSTFVTVTAANCDTAENLLSETDLAKMNDFDRKTTTCVETFAGFKYRRSTVDWMQPMFYHRPKYKDGKFDGMEYNIPYCLLGFNEGSRAEVLENCDSL